MKMNKIKDIVLRKENVFIAVVFLLFFPIKTLFYNSVYYAFDLVLNSGIVSNIYTFNYLGSLVGCREIQEVQEALGSKANLYYSIVFNFLFLVSFFCGLLLVKRFKKESVLSLINLTLFVVFCFSLYDALDYFILVLPFIDSFKSLFDITTRWVTFIEFVILFFMAIYLFFRLFSKDMKVLILLVALPASIISLIVWFVYLGPYLLPMKTQ
jgi:hypothetical protein